MEAVGFKKVKASQHADALASAVFHCTEKLAQRHRWLGLQMIRAAISVPANIAEGYESGSLREYSRYVGIARASLTEVEYYIYFLSKEGLVPVAEAERLCSIRDEAGRTLNGLANGLRRKLAAPNQTTGTPRISEGQAVYEVGYDHTDFDLGLNRDPWPLTLDATKEARDALLAR